MSKREFVPFNTLYSVPSRNGLTRPSAVRGLGFPFINMGELFAFNRISDIEMELVELNEKEKKEAVVKNGDLLFARQSLVFEGAGKCSLVVGISKTTAFESHLIRVRLNPEVADPAFYYYYFNSPFKPIRSIVQQCAQAGIRGSALDKLKVLYPSITVQHRIAAILSTYDELIEKNNRKIAILQEQAQELYKEWFVRFRFPNHETVKFEKGLPQGWRKGRFDEVCIFSRGKNITAEDMQVGSIPVISAGIKPSGFHNASNVNGVSITISSSGANAGYISLHYSNIWAADCSYASNANNIYYVYELLNNIRPYVFNLQRGAAQPHVYPKDVNRIKIIIPEEGLQVQFNVVAEKTHSAISKLMKINDMLITSRDLLLPRLMSGKLEVK